MQRRHECRATATASRQEATAPTTTRRERKPHSTAHLAEGASRLCRRAAAEGHAAAGAVDDEAGARSASVAPQAGAPRAPRDGDRPQVDGTDDHTERVRVTEHYAPRQESEPPVQKSGGRESHHRERGGTTEPAPGPPAWRRRQGRRERRATATAPMKTAPTTTGREREPPNTTHRTKRARRRCEIAAADHQADDSSAARPSRR